MDIGGLKGLERPDGHVLMDGESDGYIPDKGGKVCGGIDAIVEDNWIFENSK